MYVNYDALLFVVLIIILFIIYLWFFHTPKSFLIKNETLLFLNIVGLTIFIIYMYEVPLSDDNKYKTFEKFVNISNRNMNRLILVSVIVYYLYNSFSMISAFS